MLPKRQTTIVSEGHGACLSSVKNVMGNSNSTVVNDSTTSHTPPLECPMHQGKEGLMSKSDHKNHEMKDASECPMHKNNNASSQEYPSECPMSGSSPSNDSTMGDINPRNMMPPPNQRPAPDQPFPLDTSRIVSNIPKSGTNENWVYPSEQMFWNAMLRKGWRWKDDEISQKDMTNIINIHNAGNEQAWQEVLKWEALHANECAFPKLKKFGGKAKEYSPRAKIRQLLGYPLPFDRHDWVVDRCGKEVRYIIDYYDGGDVDKQSYQFTVLDVRPAFDSFGAAWDRTRICMRRWRYELMDKFSWGTKNETDNSPPQTDDTLSTKATSAS